MSSQKQKQSMAEHLAVQPPEPEDHEDAGAGTSPVKMAGFMLLTFSSAMAVSLWHRGFGAVFFLVFSYLDLAMLFHCRRLYARTPPWSHRREFIKMAACLLATMLTLTIFQLLEIWVLTMGQTENPK